MSKPESLPLRAARYFGVAEQPRTGFRVGRKGYLMVVTYGNRKLVMHYDEEYRPSGDALKLTERQCALLVEALEERRAA